MQSLAYNFLLNMWKMKRVNEVFIRNQSPKLITDNEVNMILATPQE